MKKIFYFIASAIVALGAVACQNDIEENIENNQQTEGLSIKVTIAEQTRIHLGNFEEDKGYKLSFDEGDVLVARAERQYGTNYFFEYVKGEGDVYTFTCTQEGVSELVGTTPHFLYLGGLHEQADDLTSYGYICNTAAEDIAGIGMYATEYEWDQPNGNLGDEGYTVTLHALPLLKFTANEPVKFESDFPSLFFVDGWESSYTTTKTGDIYLPIMFSSGNECTVTVTTESGFNKTFKKVLDENTIYNLGTIAVPNVLYLNPGIWNAEGAWFAAYFFNKEAAAVAAMTRAEAEETGKWVKMTDEDKDGIYECEAPAGYNSVLFTRMDPAKEELSFDSAWNQTADLAVPAADAANNTYAVTDWDNQEQQKPTVGNWGSNPVDAQWGLIGIAGNWETDVVMESVAHGVFAAKNVNIAESDKFKVRKDNDWAESYGAGEVNTIEPGHFVASVFGGYENDFKVSKAGTYDVYFDYATKCVYVVAPGADYTTAKEQTANPSTEPTVPGQPSEWALVGAFSGWADRSFVTTTTSNIVVLEGVTMKAAQGFLVRKPSTEWADKYGAGDVNYLQKNKYITTSKDGADMCLEADGTYDIYFDAGTKKIYIMTAGTDYNNATEQTKSGKEPVTEEPEVVDGNVLYLKPSANWKQSNARFAVYTWDGGEQWFSMNKVADGVYKVAVPKNVSNIIFCRMNPNTTANNWNNKWNQTGDLKVQSNGNNCYTVKEGTWDKGGGSWSKYTE